MKRHLCMFALVGALAACATNPAQRDAERLALYRAHAAAPVQSFHYFGRLNGWAPLGEGALAVWARPNQAYLLELSGRCIDLDYAAAISLSSRSGRVYARFDKVTVLGRGAHTIPCPIRQIQPLDLKAIKQAERDKRGAGQLSAGA